MANQKVVNLTAFNLPPKLITAADAFDDAMVKALDAAIKSGIPRSMIVGMLHGYASYHARRLCETGYV